MQKPRWIHGTPLTSHSWLVGLLTLTAWCQQYLPCPNFTCSAQVMSGPSDKFILCNHNAAHAARPRLGITRWFSCARYNTMQSCTHPTCGTQPLKPDKHPCPAPLLFLPTESSSPLPHRVFKKELNWKVWMLQEMILLCSFLEIMIPLNTPPHPVVLRIHFCWREVVECRQQHSKTQHILNL